MEEKTQKSDIIYVLIVGLAALAVLIAYAYFAVPTTGRYCIPSSYQVGVKPVETDYQHVVFEVQNYVGKDLKINSPYVEICLETSEGRLTCGNYSAEGLKLIHLGPNESASIDIHFILEQAGFKGNVTASWLNTTISFAKAVRENYYYVNIYWHFIDAEGNKVPYMSSIVCKNYISG